MATDAGAELRVDVHNIEPIPEADKDSTGLQQMWIWAGANIAPINWALGALGIVRADSRPWPQSAARWTRSRMPVVSRAASIATAPCTPRSRHVRCAAVRFSFTAFRVWWLAKIERFAARKTCFAAVG